MALKNMTRNLILTIRMTQNPTILFSNRTKRFLSDSNGYTSGQGQALHLIAFRRHSPLGSTELKTIAHNADGRTRTDAATFFPPSNISDQCRARRAQQEKSATE